MKENVFNLDVLQIDAAAEVEKIVTQLRRFMTALQRRGLVVGISGGIDSSVTAALAERACGAARVLGLAMPERDSAADTLDLSRMVAGHFGIPLLHEDISPALDALGFYRRYEEAMRMVIPGYGGGWKSKIVLASLLDSQRSSYNFFHLIAEAPGGERYRERLPLKAYLAVVAATNFKQRTRKMLEYYHADRLNFAVAGTPNRLEYDQGFFVKCGDGAADLKPIAHLYKTQVYQLAEYLGVPEEIRRRPPTTDTYSLAQGQDEFYFAVPYQEMDFCLYGRNHRIPAATVAEHLHLSAEQVERIYRDIERKRAATRYLHAPPLLMEKVPEIAISSEAGWSRDMQGRQV
ncbi:MAG: NAD(+) synthase [Desulfuromonadales bacterium]|jgi:NAD+ synthase